MAIHHTANDRRRRSVTAVHFPFLFTAALIATLSIASSAEKMYLSVDYAQFRGDSSKVFVEVYYSLGVNQLQVRNEARENAVALRLDVTLRDNGTDTVVLKQSWEVPHVIRDTSELHTDRSLIGVLSFWVHAGKYKLRVVGVDLHNQTNSDSTEFLADLRPFSDESLSLSDIELCSSIKQTPSDARNVFYKNTLEVVPNPSVIFGHGLPVVFYYIEVYNLQRRAQGGDYVYLITVSDAAGNEVLQSRKRKNRVHDSSVEVGTLNISQLRSGTYLFKFVLTDSLSSQTVSSAKKFFVYNPTIVADTGTRKGGTSGDYLASEYGLANEQDLDKEMEYVRYFAPAEEMERYKKLGDVDSKRRFVFEFWKRRDPDPSTRVNEFKQEYLGRVAYANLNFRTTAKEGWKTDRGRVHIMYGFPDELERHPNEMDSKPYEIWYYHNIQGGVEFVFIDKSSFQDYVLVHSTHRNEIRDDNWQEQLVR